MPQVFDTQNPQKNAWEVSQEWIDIMSRKEPGRYQVKSAPKVVSIPKKKVVVVGRKMNYDKADELEESSHDKELKKSKKEIVSLKPIKAGEPSKKRPIKVSAPSPKRN